MNPPDSHRWRHRAVAGVAGLIASLFFSVGCRKVVSPTAEETNPAPAVEVMTGTPAPKSSGTSATKDDPFAPLVQLQDEDYSQARTRFRTKLTRRGPSPQPFESVKPPSGATEVEYRSGELRLRAWLSHPKDETQKHAAVLFLHGGFAFGTADWEVNQPYRDAGYVVFTPMLRGENGQPGAYSFYYDEVADVLAAADYLGHRK